MWQERVLSEARRELPWLLGVCGSVALSTAQGIRGETCLQCRDCFHPEGGGRGRARGATAAHLWGFAKGRAWNGRESSGLVPSEWGSGGAWCTRGGCGRGVGELGELRKSPGPRAYRPGGPMGAGPCGHIRGGPSGLHGDGSSHLEAKTSGCPHPRWPLPQVRLRAADGRRWVCRRAHLLLSHLEGGGLAWSQSWRPGLKKVHVQT